MLLVQPHRAASLHFNIETAIRETSIQSLLFLYWEVNNRYVLPTYIFNE